MIKTYKEYLNYITEGLLTTHRISKYGYMLENYLDRSNIKYDFTVIDDTFKLTLYEKMMISYEGIFAFINNLGYFPSSMKIFKGNMSNVLKYDYDELETMLKNPSVNKLVFTFEAKFDEVKTDIPPIIYHVYPVRFKDKIEKCGLIPRSGNRLSTHPGRCYFSDTRTGANGIIKDFTLSDFMKHRTNHDGTTILYDIMEFDTTNMGDVKFYIDPNSTGFYTYDNISPKCII